MKTIRIPAITVLIFTLLSSTGTPSFPQTPEKSDNSSLRRGLERYLGGVADSGFAFSALVVVDGTTILQKGYGWADAGKTIPTTERTLFNIASITKSFTATEVFALKNAGLLSFDDSLSKFFKNVPADKRPITIGELLVHSSGLGQHYAADGITDRDSAVEKILADTLTFHPGDGFSYSNENYELLGAIIEVAGHQSYEQAIRGLVAGRADMHDTRFWGEAVGPDQPAVAAMNRTLDQHILVRNWGYIASGGIYSNVVDLYAWFTALNNGRLIDSASRSQMWTVRKQLTETGVASGWFVSSSPRGREIWTRGTEDWGHNGVLRWFPDRNILIIVLTNSGEKGDRNATANRFISDGIADIVLK